MKRWLARRLVWVSGQLARIKTRQWHYTLISMDPFVTEKNSTPTWSSCRLSYRVLTAGMRLDWDHWPHWGLEHQECLAGPHYTCEVCGGVVCDWDTDDDDES